MKLKMMGTVLLAIIALTMPVLAKDKEMGKVTPVALRNWGIIDLQQNILLGSGTQPTLTAQEAGNDMISLLQRIYPAVIESYQIVEKDNAAFQYGVLLHTTLSNSDVAQMIGAGGTADDLAAAATERLKTQLPYAFRLTRPLAAKKSNGNTFYEGAVARSMIINREYFTENIRIIAWQHGSVTEIILIIAAGDGNDQFLNTVTGVLENMKQVSSRK